MPQNKRPLMVTVLAIMFFGVGIWGGLRLMNAITFFSDLNDYHIMHGSLYLLISGGFWLVTGLLGAWGIWYGKPWAWYFALVGLVGYGIWYWIDRLFLQSQHNNSLFSLVISILVAFFSFWGLFNTKTQSFFSHHERGL